MSPAQSQDWTRQALADVESALQAWVPADAPGGLGQAMRYGVLDGGKRLRALLVLAAAQAVQGQTEAALRARIPISVCGEIAGDPKFAPLLLGLGIQDLSMAPVNLPRVKQRIRNIDYLAATRCARLIMDQWDTGRIAMLLDDFNALAV